MPYTRIIEHKHFEYGASLGKIAEGEAKEKTIISREYSDTWVQGKEPYYPMILYSYVIAYDSNYHSYHFYNKDQINLILFHSIK